MKPVILLSLGVAASVIGFIAYVAPSSAGAADSPAFLSKIPSGYRDWRFVSVAREEAPLDDIRVIVGNDTAIKAYRDGRLPFPDGTTIARLAYSCDASPENDQAFGRHQSFVAGRPKNGLQFMVKDSRKYAPTGGWGYAQFDDGKLADPAKLETCFPCHQAVQARDFVFTRWAP
jgi:hypothetical protein